MKKISNPSIIIKIITSILIAVAIPLTVRFLFSSHISIIFISIIALILPVLRFIEYFIKTSLKKSLRKKIIIVVIKVLTALTIIFFAFLIWCGFLLTPEYAFQVFSKSVQDGKLTSGPIQNLYLFLSLFFSSYFASLIISLGFLWPILWIVTVICILVSLIFPALPIYIVSVVLLFICVVYVKYKLLDKGYRWKNIIVTVLIISIGIAFGHSNLESRRAGRDTTTNVLSSQLAIVVSNIFPDIPLIYEIPEYGFSFLDESKKELGETPSLSNLPIFKITNSLNRSAIYLRSLIFDEFENNNWKITITNLDEPLKYIERVKLKEKLAFAFYSDAIYNESITKVPRPQNNFLKMQLLLQYFRYLPHTLNATKYSFYNCSPEISNGDENFGYKFDKDHMLYSLNTYYIEEASTEGASTEEKSKIRHQKLENIEQYMQLPMYIPQFYIDLANKNKTLPKQDILKNIISDLNKEFEYNLEIPYVSNRRDVLSELVQNKMGYSVHFATAVAIVARLCNIPSRYVTGFLVNFPGKNDESFVTGFSAHSWVEIWSKQNGWQTIEPTEAVIPTNYKFEKGIWTYKYKVASNILTNLQINSVLKQQINLRVREIKPIIINPFYIYLIISILLLLIFIWVFYNRVRFLFLKDKKALSWVSAKILRRISFHKIENPSKIGWLLWQKKVQEKFPQLKIVINSFVTTIIETGFGPRQLTKKDVTNVAKYFYMIKKQIKKKAIE